MNLFTYKYTIIENMNLYEFGNYMEIFRFFKPLNNQIRIFQITVKCHFQPKIPSFRGLEGTNENYLGHFFGTKSDFPEPVVNQKRTLIHHSTRNLMTNPLSHMTSSYDSYFANFRSRGLTLPTLKI